MSGGNHSKASVSKASDSKTPIRRRRWFQFSLRWLLVLCLIVSLPLGYIGWRVHRGRRIQEIARQLHDHGYYLEGYGLPEFELDLKLHSAPDDGPRSEDALSLFIAQENESDERGEPGGPGRISASDSPTSPYCCFTGPIYLGGGPPPTDDMLWIGGFGPKWFGEATLARPVKLEEIDGHGDAETIWKLIAELPELDELSIGAHSEALMQSTSAIPTLRRLQNLKVLRIEGRVDDRFLRDYQPPSSLRDLTLSKVEGGSLEGWRHFFAASHIGSLELDRPVRPKTMLEAAKSLRSLESIQLMGATLDDEALKAVFSLEPTGSLMITRSRIPEGDDRARQRLGILRLYVHDLYFRGSQWKEFREEHWESLVGDAPQTVSSPLAPPRER